MATWQGWQAEFLTAANLPTDEAVQSFLNDWSQHTAASCRNNPVDVSHSSPRATNCHKLTSTLTAKNYATHPAAATAFAAQIHSGNFSHLLAALKAPVPYQQPNPANVAADLRKWGSPAFATYYLAHSNAGSGSPGSGSGSAVEPHAHTAWHDLQRSVNKRWPDAITAASAQRKAALRSLARASRVRV